MGFGGYGRALLVVAGLALGLGALLLAWSGGRLTLPGSGGPDGFRRPPQGIPNPAGDLRSRDFDARLPRDAIRPIYEPEFVPVAAAELDPNELVMGLIINGDARAYPVTTLRRREIVNDLVGGTPVLVTW